MNTYTTEYDETLTLAHRTGPYYSEKGDYTIIEAFTKDGEMVSELYADETTGQIMQVETTKAYQRQGIASALIEYAIAHDIDLYHCPEEHCTPEGQAFAHANNQINIIDEEFAYAPA